MITHDIPILTYHQITPGIPPENLGNYAISISKFKTQMRHLRENDYVCLSLTELLQSLDDKRSYPGRAFAITFDDGYENFFTNAYPILHEYGITATVFVVTDRIHGQSDLERVKDHKYLTWEQISTLQQRGITFGSHTCTHPRLPDLSREEVCQELTAAKECLESRLGQEIQWLAYPHGASTNEIQSIAKGVGYKAAFGVSHGRYSRFNIWRRVCRKEDSLLTFVLRLSHLYHFPGYLREETVLGRFLRKVKQRIVFRERL